MPTESATAPEPPVRGVGVAVIPESSLERLARIRPGQRITGIQTDPMMLAVLVRVEGEGMPPNNEMAYPTFVDALRYQAPPLVERVDVGHLPPAQQHATVLAILADLIEHAGHLGAADGIVPDLSVNAHATWIGADNIARRHAPTGEISTGRVWCLPCSGPNHGDPVTPWPCPDYRAAAQGAVTGLTDPEGTHAQ